VARPHIEFVDVRDVPEEVVQDGPLAGARRRLVSADDSDGSYSALLSLEPGWSTPDLAHPGRPLELFCIRGDLELAGRDCDQSCYAYVPGSEARRGLSTDGGALVFLFVGPERAEDGEIEIVDSDRLRWSNAGDEHTGGGISVKALHRHPVTGDSVWLAGLVPGWFITEAETHPVAQEVFMLEGDVLLPGRGSMTAGCYFWRTPHVSHGPLITRRGALLLMRSFTGDFTTNWFDAPAGWEELHAQYLAERPLLPDL
jgi:hypothetical protein